jgi:hypothetical protein
MVHYYLLPTTYYLKKMRILSFFIALFVATTIGAQRLDYLTFRLQNGNEYSLNIASGATLTFSGNNLVGQAGGKQVTLALADLEALFFAPNATGIEETTTATVDAQFCNDALQVTAPAGTAIRVFNLEGRTLATLKKNTNGNECFSLPLSSGIYVVRVGQQTFKILAQ